MPIELLARNLIQKLLVSLASLNHDAIEHLPNTHILLETRQCLSGRQIVVSGVKERNEERELQGEKGKSYLYTM